MGRKLPRYLLRLFALCAVLACATQASLAAAAGPARVPVEVTQARRGSALRGPYSLTDHTGRRVTDETFRGRFMLIYFGYTFCPDVCPTDLAVVAAALDLLGPVADRVQPLFVTLDPKRDTAGQLASYVRLFHPRLIGLTGSEEEISKAARSYLVEYFVFDSPDNDEYEVAHTARTYLMGPDGRYLMWYPHADDPARMASSIRKSIDRVLQETEGKVP